MVVAELKKIKSSVPGQYLGYGLQPVRFCLHALTIPTGCSVSLEYLDDVAIHWSDGRVTLEQTKSSLSGNPTADRSQELWKTLANWAELCADGTIDVSSTCFTYYVTPTKSGGLVEKLNAAKDDKSAVELLEHFKEKKFQGKPGVGIEPQIMKFLSSGDKICLGIIRNFEFLTEDDPLEPLRKQLVSTLPDDTLDDFCATAIGIAKDNVEELIRDKKAPIIDAARFRRKFRAFVRKYDFSNLLVPTMPPPSSGEVAELMANLPVFVRQLTSIGASETLIATAVGDFLRSTSDKVTWAAEGEIVEDSLEELDEALLRHHLLGRDEVEDIHGHLSPEEQGRYLYRKCLALTLPLEGRTLPTYFIPGEFNCLADLCRLGWHPDYESLFSDKA